MFCLAHFCLVLVVVANLPHCQEGIDDIINNLFDDPADDGHLAAEHETLEEAELEQRENLQEESAGTLADLSLSSKTGTESATEMR